MMTLFLPPLYFAAIVVAHALANRIPRSNPLVKFLAMGGLGGSALAVHLVAVDGLSVTALAGILMYAFACELYLFFFTLVRSSVSVRLLQMLRVRDRTVREIAAVYEPEGMVLQRVERLLQGGLVQKIGDGYRVARVGRSIARLFLALQRFFRHG